MNRLILFFVFLYLPYSAFSQGIWKTYTRADGLAGDTVYCIAQDKIGNYWFGIRGAGLSKLDTNGDWISFMNGDSFVVIGDIEIDNTNNKWMIVQQLGGHYAGESHVVKFDDSTFTYYTPTWSPYYHPKPHCLGQDSLGHIWCGTSYVLAYWFDGLNWNLFSIPGLYGTYSYVHEIKTDRQGKLFFAHDDGISTLESCIFGRRTGDIAFDRQNRMWFTTFLSNWGLGMFDGMTWYSYTWEDGLLRNDLGDVTIDSSNNVWFGYAGGFGVCKYDGHTFSHFDYHDGLAHNDVRDIYVDEKGDIWFATRRGVSVLHDTTTTRVVNSNKFVNDKNSMNLFYNYPNPFNNVTQIKYALNTAQNVELTIYNLLGEEVITLINKWHQPGEYMVQWDGKNRDSKEVNSDLYIALLKSGVFKKTIKLSLIR
jgi:hypothetical protein